MGNPVLRGNTVLWALQCNYSMKWRMLFFPWKTELRCQITCLIYSHPSEEKIIFKSNILFDIDIFHLKWNRINLHRFPDVQEKEILLWIKQLYDLWGKFKWVSSSICFLSVFQRWLAKCEMLKEYKLLILILDKLCL